MTAHARTAVVHLIWGPLGLRPFEAFLDSYGRHEAGSEHDLVLLYNGVTDLGAYRSRAAHLRDEEIVLDEPCLDLAGYATAAHALDHERICFVNSYSEILVPGWLSLLESALDDDATGAAGASGSWASPLSYNLFQLGVPGHYKHAFAGRRAAQDTFQQMLGRKLRGPASNWLYALRRTLRHGRATGRFPAPHLRTNVFLVARKLFLTLADAPARTKWDTYRLESGPRSITAKLCAAGTPPVVVDARGVARRPEDWHRGNVLYQSAQEDLLVADNVTRRYASGTPAQRAVLSAFAWGDKARPQV